MNIGIGQGFNNYTPLQMAHAVSIIANEGKTITPHFLSNVLGSNAKIIESYQIESSILPIPTKDFTFIKSAMQSVVQAGTLKNIMHGITYTMGAKTGTAQVVALDKNRKQKFAGAQFKDHAWVIAFAPVDNPQIAIATLVENGGFGASAAAPIVRGVADYYFHGESDVITPIKKIKIDSAPIKTTNTAESFPMDGE